MKTNDRKVKKWLKPKYLIASGCFSAFFTFLLVLGGVIYDRDSLPNWQMLKDSGKQFYLSPVVFLVLFVLMYLFFLLFDNKGIKEKSFLPRLFHNPIVPAGILAMYYGMVYISYYPGTWCYDIIQQHQMILGLEPLTKHHPPLHTFIWGFCYYIEILTKGRIMAVVLYSVMQILAVSLVLGRVVYSVYKITKNDICLLLSFAFFLLNPTFVLFSFSPTKDPWCMMFFLLAMAYLCEWINGDLNQKEVSKRDIHQMVKVSVCLLLSSLFRNNMIYALLAAGLVFLIVFRNQWKRILLVGGAVVTVFLLINNGLYGVMGIPNVDRKEMLSAPIQQIGRTYQDYGEIFTEEEINDIDRYLGMDRMPYYNAHISDPLKHYFKTEEYKKDKNGFYSLWFSLGKKHPDSYITAYLSQYSPYWYIRSKSYDVYTGSPYVEDYISTDNDYAFERKGFLPQIYAFYHKIANESESVLLSRGWPFWISFTVLFYAIVRKKKKDIIIPFICVCYMLTLFLGPLCIIRYALPVLGAAPLMVLSVAEKNPS